MYIWALFLVDYVPAVISYIVTFIYEDETEIKVVVAGISRTIFNLSSINPLLYCW